MSPEEVGMHPLIEARRAEIQGLCRRLGIRRLDLFGSATSDAFDLDSSDVDVLVEFDAGRDGFDYYGTYFALKEGLERLLGRAVDVVSVTAIRNPYFRDQVMRTRQPLYAA
ncbi:DNA polymerase, beta-like region [Frankia casuarinae]|jgi:predicted nucleotidyltransferase|uniref:DNA polymerase, beta-like region n=4 Tax=Frankiaceae TaxID=74712 RepID=Q2JAY1_FRACC|nr:DNA polymerase, beta-like region [Frankia casuarinae]